MNKPIYYFALLATSFIFQLSGNKIHAQQTPLFAEYNYNPYLINSAYAGLAPSTEISLGNSGFFNQVEGSPRSFSLSLHTPLNRGKVGLGAGFIRDEIGVTTSTNAFATYSYKIFFDTKKNRPYWQVYTPNSLSFAITGGIQQYQDNLLDLGIMNDPNFAQNINASIPTIGLGILLNLADIYVGLSAPKIWETNWHQMITWTFPVPIMVIWDTDFIPTFLRKS